MTPTANKGFFSAVRELAALVLEDGAGDELPPVPVTFLVVLTEPGVKTAEGLAMHELRAELAAEALDAPLALTVPLPAKLHEAAFLPLAR
jgi:hypothetical protein